MVTYRLGWAWRCCSYFLVLKASELFVEDGGDFHKVRCPRKGSVAVFEGNDQLLEERRRGNI